MVIIGSGGERLFAPLVKSYAGVHHMGAIPHRELAQQLASARVCLFSSKCEGSPLAGNEALALGCTIVGPNLPFVKSISASGPFGTVAGGRSSRQMTAALEHEMRAWENNECDAQEIANFKRERLSPTRIAGQITALAEGQNSFVDAKTDSGSLTA